MSEIPINRVIRNARNLREQGKCPFCTADINSANPEEFRDELSWKEYRISGLCQKCQDQVFENEEEEEKLDHDHVQKVIKEMTPTRVQTALDQIMHSVFWDVYMKHDELKDDCDPEYGPDFSIPRVRIRNILESLNRGGRGKSAEELEKEVDELQTKLLERIAEVGELKSKIRDLIELDPFEERSPGHWTVHLEGKTRTGEKLAYYKSFHNSTPVKAFNNFMDDFRAKYNLGQYIVPGELIHHIIIRRTARW